MMKLTAYITALIFSAQALASYGPISIKELDDASKQTITNIQVPQSKATKTAANTFLVEGLDKNLLVNPGFEHQVPDTGWTSATTGTAVLTPTVTTLNGYPGENQFMVLSCAGGASGGTCSFKQEVTTIAGAQGFVSALLKSAAGSPSASMKAYTLVGGTRTTELDFTNTGTTAFWDESFNVPEVSTGTSLGIEIVQTAAAGQTIVSGIERAQVKLGNVTVSQPVITAWRSWTPTFTGFGTVTCSNCMEWRQVGTGIELRGKFTSGTSTAVEARMTLPNSWTASVPSLQLVGKANVDGSSASTFSGKTVLAEASTAYVTFGAETSSLNGITKTNGTSIAGAGNIVSLIASIPIANLSGSTQVFESQCGAACESRFDFFVSTTGVVSGENFDVVNGNATVSSSDSFSIPLNTGIFTESPNIQVTSTDTFLSTCSATGTQEIEAISATTSSVTINFKCVSGTSSADHTPEGGFYVTLTKKGADSIASRSIKGSFLGMASTPGAQKPVVHSCRITNSGVPTVDTASTLCARWVSSLTDLATGQVRFNISSGVLGASPVCNCNPEGAGYSCVIAGAANTSQVVVRTRDATNADTDIPVNITCHGEAP